MIASRTIPAEYIETFLPIQELDEVKPLYKGGIAPVGKDDLFLMSQISAYATGDSNAVAVSKKISYGSLSEKISDDFAVDGIKLSIDGISSNVSNLSSYTLCCISGLSSAIETSADTLSTYTNSICISLSTTIENDYIKNYTQTCSLISSTNEPGNPALLANEISIVNGRITVNSHVPISNLIVPKDWRIAEGGIGGDYYLTNTLLLDNDRSEFSYEVVNDCYLNFVIYAVEDDSFGPLEVWITSGVLDDYGFPITTLYKVFNNPGGFSGKDIVNNYQFSIPVKTYFGNNANGKTSITIKYKDNANNFKEGSYVEITEYYFYAIPAKDDLCAYVQKMDSDLSAQLTPEMFKIAYNENGLITDAEQVYYGVATSALCGLVKLGDFSDPYYQLKLSSENEAYVNVPHATSSTYGTVRFSSSSESGNHEHNFGDVHYSTSLSHFLSCGLEQDSSGNAVTFVPIATDNNFGIVKLSSDQIDMGNPNKSDPLSSFLGTDKDGRAYVTIPYARYVSKDVAYPGIVRTGQPDTTSIRVVRSVYLNEKGIACVNVANQIGVGPFHFDEINTGYTTSAIVDLSSSIPSTTFDNTYHLSSYAGKAIRAQDYGDNVFYSESQVNGWFMAQLVYEGAAGNANRYDSDPFLQIICDGIAVTTIRPKCIQGAPGKKFTYSTQLGVFRGGPEKVSSYRLFAAVSNSSTINNGNDKIIILIKEANFD